MAISATYVQLQNAIADELGGRTDLLIPLTASGLTLSPIKNAIQSAIAKWEREAFYFNRTYNGAASPLFTTVSGQEFYTTSDAAAIATAPIITEMHILISANRYPLEKQDWQYLDTISISPTNTGQPTEWAYDAEQIRLYPIPDAAYPVRATRVTRLTALSADADTNVWTQDAYDLIKSEAKLILAQEVIHDATIASEMQAAIYGSPGSPVRGYLAVLKGETTRRQARGRVQPTTF